MTGETQARRRKDKKKARKDSATDHSDSEEIKDHSESGGTSCLTLLVFLILTVGICVLGGLVYVHTISVPHVPTPPAAPKPAAEPIVNTIIETVVEVPAEEASESQPAGAAGAGLDAAEDQQQQHQQPQTEEIVEVIEQRIVYVDEHGNPAPQAAAAAAAGQDPGAAGPQVVYVDAPPEAGIQLEGSESELPTAGQAQPLEDTLQVLPPAGALVEGGAGPAGEVVPAKEVRVRQVVKLMTAEDGTITEEVVEETELTEQEIQEELAAAAAAQKEEEIVPEVVGEVDAAPDTAAAAEVADEPAEEVAVELDQSAHVEDVPVEEVYDAVEDAADAVDDVVEDVATAVDDVVDVVEELLQDEVVVPSVEKPGVVSPKQSSHGPSAVHTPHNADTDTSSTADAKAHAKAAKAAAGTDSPPVVERKPTEDSKPTTEDIPSEKHSAKEKPRENVHKEKTIEKKVEDEAPKEKRASKDASVERQAKKPEPVRSNAKEEKPMKEQAKERPVVAQEKAEQPVRSENVKKEKKEGKPVVKQSEHTKKEEHVDKEAVVEKPVKIKKNEEKPVVKQSEHTKKEDHIEKEVVVEKPVKIEKNEEKPVSKQNKDTKVEEHVEKEVVVEKPTAQDKLADKPKEIKTERKAKGVMKESLVDEKPAAKPVTEKDKLRKQHVQEQKTAEEPAKDKAANKPINKDTPVRKPPKQEKHAAAERATADEPVAESVSASVSHVPDNPPAQSETNKPKPGDRKMIEEPLEDVEYVEDQADHPMSEEPVEGETAQMRASQEQTAEDYIDEAQEEPLVEDVTQADAVGEVFEQPAEDYSQVDQTYESHEGEEQVTADEVYEEAQVEPEEDVAVRKARAAEDGPAPADEAYEHAEITGAEDWAIREQLDQADALIDKDHAAALNAFGALLASHPQSPRALFGRARALAAQAMAERSNNVLDKAIATFKSVLALDVEKPLPLALFRIVAETTVQQMRFRGLADQAARVQQRLIQKFPDDYMLRNHLATVFMTYNQNAAAEEVLREVLRLWPENGYAKVHLGFIRRLENKYAEAASLLQAGLDSDEPGVHDSKFYYSLGDAYHRIGQIEKSKQVYGEGAKRGLFLSTLQRSIYNVERLTARPYWTAEQTGSQPLISALEDSWEAIRDELKALLDSERPEDGFRPESEDLSRAGDWKQFMLFRRGRREQYACANLPVTCGLIDKYPEAAGNRRGQVKFSMMSAGTRVWPHTGPTNCRLRMHLGLIVPKGTGITVAGETRTWEEGKVLILDDSFEHEVWNNATKPRFILIVDIWHPELTTEERSRLPAI